jgi:hypothetical protein
MSQVEGSNIQPTRRQWLAVVRPDIDLTPGAQFLRESGGFEAINMQGRFMVTGPIATLAPTIDEQLANSVSAN